MKLDTLFSHIEWSKYKGYTDRWIKIVTPYWWSKHQFSVTFSWSTAPRKPRRDK